MGTLHRCQDPSLVQTRRVLPPQEPRQGPQHSPNGRPSQRYGRGQQHVKLQKCQFFRSLREVQQTQRWARQQHSRRKNLQRQH